METTQPPPTHPGKEGLDRLVTRFLHTGHPVSGKWLRANSTGTVLDSLLPGYATRTLAAPNDLYRPTSKGLFASSQADRCLAILDALLATLSHLFRENPDAAHYCRADVQKHSASPETPTTFVAVLSVCGLAGTGGWSDSDFRFHVPSDIEHLIGHTSGRDMLHCQHCEATRWNPPPPTALDSPATHASIAPLAIGEERLDCSFITDLELARILQRDCNEIVSCMAVQAWKASMILCGSALEGLLMFALESTGQASASQKPVTEQGLAELIASASSRGLLTQMAPAMPEALRKHRNLVHPQKERGSSYRIARLEAEIAFRILKVALRDVSAALTAQHKLATNSTAGQP